MQAGKQKTSVRFRFGSPPSSNVVVCGHRLATLSLTINETLALVAAHLNAEVILAVTVYNSVRYSLPLAPPPGTSVPATTSSETRR